MNLLRTCNNGFIQKISSFNESPKVNYNKLLLILCYWKFLLHGEWHLPYTRQQQWHEVVDISLFVMMIHGRRQHSDVGYQICYTR